MAPQAKGYLASDAQVATLAREYVANATGAEQARGTYLRILVAHSLRELSKSTHKRYSAAEALGAVETAHAHLYAIVVEATLTADTAPDPDASDEERKRRTQERNRRTTFARTSKSALANFVKAGGRLVTLEPETVTRDALARFTRTAREGPASLPDRVKSTVERLETMLKQLAEESPEAAREVVEGLTLELQSIVTPPTRMRGTRKVGNLTLTAEH
jgi:hypothetical protein